MLSLPHSAGVGPTGPGICQKDRNPLVADAVLRALLVDLDEWVSNGEEPPRAACRELLMVRSSRHFLRVASDFLISRP